MTMTAIDVVVIVLCVLVVVGVAVGWAIRKKKGKTGCCGECAHCSSACPSAPKAQENEKADECCNPETADEVRSKGTTHETCGCLCDGHKAHAHTCSCCVHAHTVHSACGLATGTDDSRCDKDKSSETEP